MRNFPATTIKVIAAVATLAACGVIAPPFPRYGSTPFRIEGVYTPSTGHVATPMIIYRSGAQLRVETVLPRLGRTAIVFDRGNNTPYALAPISAYAALAASAPPPPAATPTGAPPSAPTPSIAPLTPGVAGIAIRISDADAPQPFETPWAALGPANSKAAGGCRVAHERGHQWRERTPTAGVEPRIACVTNDGIVLEVRQGSKTIFEASRLQRGRLNAALFGVPANYQRFDPQAVAASEAPATPTALATLTPG